MTVSEAKKLSLSTDPAVAAAAQRVLSARAERRRRTAPKRKASRAPRAERKAADDAKEAAGKAAAMKRSEDFAGKPRCEFYDEGKRCVETATDAHHCLGGTHKKEMEDLPNGEGFQAGCRVHHEVVGHSPSRAVSLANAMEHAIRINSNGLRRHVAAALALYEGKHGRAA